MSVRDTQFEEWMLPAAVLQWKQCAVEGGTCNVTKTSVVRFGAKRKYTYLTVSAPIQCSTAVFGDPIPGVAKTCAVKTYVQSLSSKKQSPTPPVATTTPTPTPTTTIPVIPPVVTNPTPTTGLVASIPSNFDINSQLVPAWSTGAIPPKNSPDVVGAFRFILILRMLGTPTPSSTLVIRQSHTYTNSLVTQRPMRILPAKALELLEIARVTMRSIVLHTGSPLCSME
jgi:hypothetical protein